MKWVALLALVLPMYANAAPILIISSDGELTGATNVDVGGTLYDVVFDDRGFYDVFGLSPVLDASSAAEALAFSQALMDQVFLDSLLGAFDSIPSLTLGCEDPTLCSAVTPYSFSQPFTSVGRTLNRTINSTDSVGTSTLIVGNPELGGTGLTAPSVWAKWSLSDSTPTPLPEPSTIALVTVGLLAIGLVRRRRTQ